jgi:hypothetical protein
MSKSDKTIITVSLDVEPTDEQWEALRSLVGKEIDLGGSEPVKILDVKRVDPPSKRLFGDGPYEPMVHVPNGVAPRAVGDLQLGTEFFLRYESGQSGPWCEVVGRGQEGSHPYVDYRECS